MFGLFESEHILENVREASSYLGSCLEKLMQKYSCIRECRGLGLMRGLVFDRPVKEIPRSPEKQPEIRASADTGPRAGEHIQ